jgi:hypothetical protein
MAKFGLKLKSTDNRYSWLYSWDERDAFGAPVKPLGFNSVEEAEDYGQAHEIPNFLIEPINEDDFKREKRLLNG